MFTVKVCRASENGPTMDLLQCDLVRVEYNLPGKEPYAHVTLIGGRNDGDVLCVDGVTHRVIIENSSGKTTEIISVNQKAAASVA